MSAMLAHPAPAPACGPRSGCTCLAAVAALGPPRAPLGDLVEAVERGTTDAHVDQMILVLAVFLVLQTVLTRDARYRSQVMGELCSPSRGGLRRQRAALPWGSWSRPVGDLLTRTQPATSSSSGWSVRVGAAERAIAVVTADPDLRRRAERRLVGRAALLLGVPPLVIGLRRYLARAKAGYLRETASYSQINAHAHRDGRGRPHRRGAGPGPGAARRRSTAT